MTAKKTAPKTDKVQVKNDLDKLASEVSTDHEPYEFWFKGTRFVTQNPYDLRSRGIDEGQRYRHQGAAGAFPWR